MDAIEIKIGNIQCGNDAADMLAILNDYMLDPMGKSAGLDDELAREVIKGLKLQANYCFFLAYINGQCAGVANCFVNFSTFKAKPLLNIHDFAVSPMHRRKGIGEALLQFIFNYSEEQGYCRVNLEVRNDNAGAQNLYRKMGFDECNPPMYFWEKLF
jgi:ribosomal protein S18 acetylase RimI-like enzyme